MSTTFSKIRKPTAQNLSVGKNADKKIVIAVDGPSASGKGTLAKQMAARLGYAYLDTGALYRAVALATLEMDGNPGSLADVQPALDVVIRNLTPELLDNPELRTAAVTAGASKVAALPQVRQALLDYQRDFAQNPPGNVGGAILDGRDIGTVICPDADVKLYVTAGVEERAHRRFMDLEATGISYHQVLQDMKERDLRDQSRVNAPAKAATDAFILDTTNIGISEVLEEAVAIVKSKFIAELTDSGQN